MLFKFWSVTSHFLFSCEMQFSMELVKALQTNAVPIASLNLSIIHWILSKNMA